MNFNNITQRQFERTLIREGRDIINKSTGNVTKVVFSKMSSGGSNKTPQERLKIHYLQTSDLKKGDIFEYKNNNYLIMNTDCLESDIYYTSTAVKCNIQWNLFGTTFDFVVSGLDSPNPRGGTFVSALGGVINLYTGDRPEFHKKDGFIGLNASIQSNGGCFKLVNKFFVDNIIYFYFESAAAQTAEFRIYDSNNCNIISLDSNYQMAINTISGTNYLPNVEYTFSSSDETVATVNENGLITPLKAGSVTITASGKTNLDLVGSWKDIDLTSTFTYTIK